MPTIRHLRHGMGLEGNLLLRPANGHGSLVKRRTYFGAGELIVGRRRFSLANYLAYFPPHIESGQFAHDIR